MGDAFDILMITHAELSKGYFSAMELILDINNEDMEIVSFEAGEALDAFSEKLAEIIEKKYKHRKIIVLHSHFYQLLENWLLVSIFRLF